MQWHSNSQIKALPTLEPVTLKLLDFSNWKITFISCLTLATCQPLWLGSIRARAFSFPRKYLAALEGETESNAEQAFDA